MESTGDLGSGGDSNPGAPFLASHSDRELISLLLHHPPSWLGEQSHPKAERGAPKGGSRLARNDCPSVTNLLLPRASGSEARTEHNGFLELKGPGRGASGGSPECRGSESRHWGLLSCPFISFLPLQIPDTTSLRNRRPRKEGD